MREYLVIIFAGLLATFLYNFFACLLRAAGNSVAPLCFLGLGGAQYRARSAVCAPVRLGHCRRGGGDGLFAVRLEGSA